MPRRGENIYKRKDGRWEGRYIKTNGTNSISKYGYVYGKTYTEVKEKLFKSKCENTENDISDIALKPFAYFSELWLCNIKPQVKLSTYVKYSNIVTNHLNPALGMCLISALNTDIVRKIAEEKLVKGNLKDGRALAPKTIKDILSVLKLVLNYAEGLGAKVNCRFDTINIKSGRQTAKTLTEAEQRKLTEHLINNINFVNLGILISLYTGIRIGELCALRFEDILLEDKILKVNKTMQRLQNFSESDAVKTNVIITSPKSESSQREIPLPEFLVKLMKNMDYSPGAFLLTGDNARYIEPRSMENKFKKCLKECDLEDVAFHQLRHRFATYCVELGFEIKSLSEILGHSSVNITLNRYVHSSMELKRKNMAKIQDKFICSPSDFQSYD